jgi:hypothetical protein
MMTWKRLEGGGHCLIKVLYRHLLGRADKNHENSPSVQPISGPRSEPGTSRIRRSAIQSTATFGNSMQQPCPAHRFYRHVALHHETSSLWQCSECGCSQHTGIRPLGNGLNMCSVDLAVWPPHRPLFAWTGGKNVTGQKPFQTHKAIYLLYFCGRLMQQDCKGVIQSGIHRFLTCSLHLCNSECS